MNNRKSSKKWTAMGILLFLVIVGVVLYFWLRPTGDPGPEPERGHWVYPEPRRAAGAIASNGGPCAAIGMKILQKYGNAVDALIATMLCDGVTCMQNMGLGGGFIGTLFIKKLGKVVTINARESAPAGAKEDMFVANKTLSLVGGLAAGVPGELKGYWEMHKLYGGPAKWSELFEGTIELCEQGVPVGSHLVRNLNSQREFIMKMPTLKKLLLNEKGELPKYGDKIKLPKLAETLRIIAEEGANALYNGSLTAGFVKDIQDNGGIITEQDMASYSVRWEEPVSVKLSTGETVYSVPPPGSGPILALIIKLLDKQLSPSDDQLTNTFKTTEAFKYAYGIRSELGDSHFINITEILNQINNETFINDISSRLDVPMTSNNISYYGSHFVEDHGTANIVVYGPDGDAVSATSTINTIFGSGVVSESTGIIVNNEMDDFSSPGIINYFNVPPSSENFIAPGKRPMSSMCPAIILDKRGEPILIAGGAGGTRITTSTALTIIRNLWFNKTTTEAVKEPRFHHQLSPMVWEYEPKLDNKMVEGMKSRGHSVKEANPSLSCVTAISIRDGVLGASSDMRRGGNTSYLITSEGKS